MGKYTTKMPAPPKTSNDAPINTKDLTILDYGNMKIPKCQGDNSKDETRDSTPSRPPWTTFTGVLEARRDSVVGQRILQMDPKAIDGKHTYDGRNKTEWVRGIWFAPTNWNEIPNF